MTTIAYRDGVLAADSKVTGGNVYVGQTRKITKIIVEEELSWVEQLIFRKEPKQRQYLVGMAGTLEDCKEYIDCIFFGETQSRGYEASILAIYINEQGEEIITYYDGNGTKGFAVQTDYAAIGSGDEIALGAMYVGADAVAAVEAASFHDNMSGGEIQTVSFEND